MRETNQIFINDMRSILIKKIKTPAINDDRRDEVHTMNLRDLYRLAWKQNPRMHCDTDLMERFSDARNEHNALKAWVEEGMSPLIFFATKPTGHQIADPALTTFFLHGIEVTRDELIGNLSLREFVSFLRDAVAMNLIDYEQVLKIVQMVPEVLSNRIYHYAGRDDNVFSKAFWRSAEKTRFDQGALARWVPLLMLTSGSTDEDFYLASNAFRLNDQEEVKRQARLAAVNATSAPGHLALVRFINLKFRDWSSFTLDELLCREFSEFGNSPLMDRVDFWIDKAVEAIRALEDHNYLAWPAGVYAACYKQVCMGDSELPPEERQQAHELMMVSHPKLYEIRSYIKRECGLPLERALGGSVRVLDLMSSELLSIFNDREKNRFVEMVAPILAKEISRKISRFEVDYDTPFKIDQSLDGADPACAQAIDQHVHDHFSFKDFVGREDGANENLLYLALRVLRDDSRREEAIKWCENVRSRKWRPVAMRILNFTPADVKLSASQREEFLAEDLGL
jgi:hypothetical protein